MFVRIVLCLVCAASLVGCGPSYSPDTYSTNAVQQANKVDPGIVVGVREVGVSTSGTVGAAVGGAAGGIAGAQVGEGAGTALSTLGGVLVGGIAGSATEHVVGDTRAFEYIVRKPNGDLISVTQKDVEPLKLGEKVLVIAGNQARVVRDYTVPVEPAKQKPEPPKTDTTTAPSPPPVATTPLAPPEQPAPEQPKAPENP